MNCDIQTISYTDCILSIFDSNSYPIAEFKLVDTKITANFKAETLTITDGSSIMIINASQLPSINGGAFATLLDLYTYLETQRNLCQCGCGGGGGGNIDSINGDTTPAQTLTKGTSGTDFDIVDNGTGDHKFNLPTASATNRGALSNTDWSTFNSKQNALGFTPEDVANKSSSYTASSTTTYANTKALVDGLATKAISMINCNPADTIAGSTTSYWQPFSNAADSTTETSRVFYLNIDTTLKNLLIRTATSQPGTGNQIITVRHELASTSITVTIAAGSAAGTFTDYTNTHSAVKNNRISIQSVNNATTAGAQVNQITLIAG